MTAEDHFQKSKALVVLYSGALLLSVWVGIDLDGGSFQLLPLQNQNLLDEVILCVAAYYFLRSLLFWGIQNEVSRRSVVYIIDNVFSVLVFVAASGSYLVVQTDVVERVGDTLIADIWGVIRTLAVLIVGAVVSAFGSNIAGQSIKARARYRSDAMIKALLSKKWFLVYVAGRQKARRGENYGRWLQFLPDGEIGEGVNHNETNWREAHGYLEILNKRGELFSRFRYEPDNEQFKGTGDDDVLVSPGQMLVADLDSWKKRNRLKA